ncbi:uncharacterized protein A4U43_C09F16180 [Asparagus officinalis]|uniref:Uncharacterized protein n=1 Tax=Asparagus officinalis TaxID=4686 RepID=A0A5P1E7X7_ASPOF|nr:uncharacterized protein A4U43_C09F16180 [Asparagus officinalis]
MSPRSAVRVSPHSSLTVGGELVGDGNDTTSREGFVTECQALDDEIVETGGGGEVSVEEDVIEEGLEEAVYHGRGEDGVAKEKGDGGLIRRGEDVGVIARDGMEAGEDDEKASSGREGRWLWRGRPRASRGGRKESGKPVKRRL